MRKKILLFLFLWSFSFYNLALSLTFDDGFNTDVDHRVSAIAVQKDGRIVIGGMFSFVNGIKRSYIARLNYDGSLDDSFVCNLNGFVYTIVIQNDDKIIIGGSFTEVNGVARSRIARLNSDGSLDYNFKADANAVVNSIVIYSENKIIVGGNFTVINGVYKNRIAMLDSKGNIDTSFNTNVAGGINAISVQQDKKIIIGGIFTSVNSIPKQNIARLNPDGSLDDTFITNVNNYVNSIAVQVDGRIVIGGDFTRVNSIIRNRIARINGDGSLDNSFDPNANSTVKALAIQPDGRIIIGGFFTSLGGNTIKFCGRINFDGSIDTDFNPNFDYYVESISIGFDGKIILGGNFSNAGSEPRKKLARLYSNGRLDKTLITSLDGTVHAIAVQDDGKILLGGNFTTINGVTKVGFARIDVDGSLDTAFNVIIDINNVYCIAIQDDGKIIISGNFNLVNGVTRNNIARLNKDGSLDNSFNPNVNGPVYSMAIQKDGKIIIGGNFTSVGGSTRKYIARINTNGSLDSDFNFDLDNYVNTIALESNGNILIGGAFTKIGLFGRNYIARLTASEGLDISFNPDANGQVHAIAVQADGNMIVGGLFTNIGGVSKSRIAKLNSSGTVVESFIASANSLVNTIVIQSDGRILIGGYFTEVNNMLRNYIARIFPNGMLDTTLNWDVNNYVFSIAVQGDGKILVGGSFNQAGNLTREKIARLSSDYSYDNLYVSNDGYELIWERWGTSLLSDVFFEYSMDGTSWLLLGDATKDSDGNWILRLLSLPYEQIGYIRAKGKVVSGTRNASKGIISSVKQFYNFYKLDVTKAGTGNGIVVDSTDGIMCGDDCSEIYTKNTIINLIAIPDSDSEFVGWEGSCNGLNPSINLTISKYKNCVAVFQKVIYLNDGAYVTASASVKLNLYPFGTPTKMMILTGKTWGKEESYLNTKNITVPGGDGKKDVYVRLFIDGIWKEYKDSIYLDVKAPSGGIQINGGNQFTTSTNVILNLSVADMQDYEKLFMKFSNDKTIWTDWESFKETKSYVLADGEGLKTVYVQYKDSGGKTSPIYSDQITYRTTLGYILDNAIIVINSGLNYTNKTGVVLTINPPDLSYKSMALSQDAVKWSSWAVVTSPKNISLSGQDGIKRVYVKFKKEDETESDIYYDEIILDRKKPVGVLLINNGAYITNSSLVKLTFNVADELSGVEFISFSNDGTNFNTYGYPTILPIPYNLSLGDGVKKVYMKITDKAGNTSSTIMDSIILDTTSPTGKVVINGGAQSTTIPELTVSISASGAVWMKVSIDGVFDTEEWETYKTKKVFTIPPIPGTKEVKVIFRDLAGNISAEYSDTIEFIFF